MSQIIVLLGYMGSGKSAVGKALAEVMNRPFVDLDDYIVKNQGMSITEIFDSKGALYFRKVEHEQLELLVESNDSQIISLGGGTPCYYNHMEYLNQHSLVTTIYLDTSIPVLANRLVTEMDHRPILKKISSKDDLVEFIGKHLFERRQYYNKAMKRIKIYDSETSVEQITQEIISQLY